MMYRYSLPLIISSVIFGNSVSQNGRYPQFCQLAGQNDLVFQTFRSQEAYQQIVETCCGYDYGVFFLQEINERSPHLLPYLDKICLEDKLGSPVAFHYPQIGTISPTVLRYVKIVGDLQREWGDLHDFKILEIGGGFGGQCKIIHDICGFSHYTIVDLPECLPLINKFLSSFSIKNFTTLSNCELKEKKRYDLVISNYAFSEISRNEQMEYMEAVIKLAPRGFFIYNHFPTINPFSMDEFISLLQGAGKKVKVIREDPGRVGDLIIWNE
jgi:hypothetical protein